MKLRTRKSAVSADVGTVSLGPAPGGNGWEAGLYAYDRDNDYVGDVYKIAYGQSFVAPASPGNTKLRMTGFSALAYCGYTWGKVRIRMRVYDSLTYATRTVLYEYATPSPSEDYYTTAGINWLNNVGTSPTWLFRNKNVGEAKLIPGKTYYWEIEFLWRSPNFSPNPLTYVRGAYGRTVGSSDDYGDSWTGGRSYQRWSDGTYGSVSNLDLNFKMEFKVISEPATGAMEVPDNHKKK